MRLLNVSNIPKALLKDKKLYLPTLLVDSWEKLLIKHELLEIAKAKHNKRSVGGASIDETKTHLAHRYNGSSARNLLSILDPKSELKEISDIYVKLFSGGKLLLVDLPCGSGAGIVSILTTFSLLREQGVLPRDYIEIKILCCDISDDALENTSDQLNFLKDNLERQAIMIDFEIQRWDITCEYSTADLIKKIHKISDDSNKYFITINNFSGFLDQNNNWELAKDQIKNIFIHTRSDDTTIIWIEPNIKQSSNLFSKFFKLLKKITKNVRKDENDDIDETYAMSNAECFNHFSNSFFKISLNIGKAIIPKGDKYE